MVSSYKHVYRWSDSDVYGETFAQTPMHNAAKSWIMPLVCRRTAYRVGRWVDVSSTFIGGIVWAGLTVGGLYVTRLRNATIWPDLCDNNCETSVAAAAEAVYLLRANSCLSVCPFLFRSPREVVTCCGMLMR